MYNFLVKKYKKDQKNLKTLSNFLLSPKSLKIIPPPKYPGKELKIYWPIEMSFFILAIIRPALYDDNPLIQNQSNKKPDLR